MIGARIFSVWDGLVGSVALIAIIVLAFCVMVGAVKAGDVPRHLGVIVAVGILLIMLPAIIFGLWSAMSVGQHFGIFVLGVVVCFLLSAISRRHTREK